MTNEISTKGESLADADFTVPDKVIETPLDAWIAIALYVDRKAISKLVEIVSQAINRLSWEIGNVPVRWVNVAEHKRAKLSHWIAVQEKLRDLEYELDPIPF